MSEAFDTISDDTLRTVTRKDIESLSDRLYASGTSTLSVVPSREQRCDLVLASRCLRRLLAAYERTSGRQLAAVMIQGGAQ